MFICLLRVSILKSSADTTMWSHFRSYIPDADTISSPSDNHGVYILFLLRTIFFLTCFAFSLQHIPLSYFFCSEMFWPFSAFLDQSFSHVSSPFRTAFFHCISSFFTEMSSSSPSFVERYSPHVTNWQFLQLPFHSYNYLFRFTAAFFLQQLFSFLGFILLTFFLLTCHVLLKDGEIVECTWLGQFGLLIHDDWSIVNRGTVNHLLDMQVARSPCFQTYICCVVTV